MRESVGKVKEAELLKIEVGEFKSLNTTLKSKLQEAQESLKSNENLITYLNKQLNEKPNSAMSTLSSMGGKPPLTTFKPSFTSVEQL